MKLLKPMLNKTRTKLECPLFYYMGKSVHATTF